MNYLFSIFIIFFLINFINSSIVSLSPSTLASYEFDPEKKYLLFITAPWCGYCSKINNLVDILNFRTSDLNIDLDLVKVSIESQEGNDIKKDETDLEQILSEKFDFTLDGFPSILYIKEGKTVEYTGDRSTNSVLQFLLLNEGKGIEEINEISQLNIILDHFENQDMLETGILAHGHFLFLKNREEYSKSELEIIEDLALKLSFFTFSISFDGSLPEDFDLLEDSLILFTPNNDLKTFSISSIKNYISASIDKISFSIIPPSFPLTPATQNILASLPIHVHALLIHDEDELVKDEGSSLYQSLKTVANQYIGDLLIVEITSDQHTLLSHMQVKFTSLPQLIIIDNRNEEKPAKYSFSQYLFDREEQKSQESSKLIIKHIEVNDDSKEITHSLPYTLEDLDEFISSILIHDVEDLSSFIRSENSKNLYFQNTLLWKNIERHGIKEQKKVLNMTNLSALDLNKEIFENSDTNSILYLHAPWCNHCIPLESVLIDFITNFNEELSKKQQNSNNNIAKNNFNLKVFKIDGSKNDLILPNKIISGYPSIFFIPSEFKKIEENKNGEKKNKKSNKKMDYLPKDLKEIVEYTGERTSEGLIQFVLEQFGFSEKDEKKKEEL